MLMDARGCMIAKKLPTPESLKSIHLEAFWCQLLTTVGRYLNVYLNIWAKFSWESLDVKPSE